MNSNQLLKSNEEKYFDNNIDIKNFELLSNKFEIDQHINGMTEVEISK